MYGEILSSLVQINIMLSDYIFEAISIIEQAMLHYTYSGNYNKELLEALQLLRSVLNQLDKAHKL